MADMRGLVADVTRDPHFSSSESVFLAENTKGQRAAHCCYSSIDDIVGWIIN